MKKKSQIIALAAMAVVTLTSLVYANIKANEAVENASLAEQLATKAFEFQKIAEEQRAMALEAAVTAREAEAEAAAQVKLAQQAVEDCRGK